MRNPLPFFCNFLKMLTRSMSDSHERGYFDMIKGKLESNS